VRRVSHEHLVRKGVTSVYDFPYSKEGIIAYQELKSEGQLPLRIRMSITVPRITDLDSLLKLGLRGDFGDESLKLGGVKVYVDGDGDTAAVHKHFAGPPDYYGLLAYTQDELNEMVMKVHRAGMQVLIHAVGDRAQCMALDSIERAARELPRKNHRHRVEHLGDFFGTKEMIKRVRDLGVIPVVTPAFPYISGDYYRSRIGSDPSYLYGALRSMFDQGIMPPGSSDCTGSIIESMNPFFNIWCAVTQEMWNEEILCPEERITVLEGLRMYTVNSAYAGFEDNIKGTIESGKLADLIVLSEDPLKVPVQELKNIQITKTIIGGQVVYES
jgi:predicted amidohydrolase YtcJ